MKTSYRRVMQRAVVLTIISVFVAASAYAPTTFGLNQEQLRLFQRDIRFLEVGPQCSAPVEGGEPIELSVAQEANARAIIGVAKTYNLGQYGAAIGVMAALSASGLKNYANANLPESQENPEWLALAEPRPLGNNYDLVGIMQLRAGVEYPLPVGKASSSTYGAYADAAIVRTPRDDSDEQELQRQAIVNQLMDPAYAAQAFFGTPPDAAFPDGVDYPEALQHGLQNLEDWQTMTPWDAIRRVQNPLVPSFLDYINDSSSSGIERITNYAELFSRITTLVSTLWESSPPIPLPIAVTGGTVSVVAGCSTGGKDKIIQKIREFAWPTYSSAGTARSHTKKGENPAAYPGSGAKSAYLEAVKRSKYVGGCGSAATAGEDCGAFVTIVMRESGADPDYNPNNCWTRCQQDYLRANSGPGSKYTRVLSPNDLQPGDIAIRHNRDTGKGHTLFFVGDAIQTDLIVDASGNLVEGSAWNGKLASASYCEREPMAEPRGVIDERYFNGFEWYHLN